VLAGIRGLCAIFKLFWGSISSVWLDSAKYLMEGKYETLESEMLKDSPDLLSRLRYNAI